MFDEKNYKEMFSQVTASGETHRRILTMANNNKQNRTVGFASKVLIAAVMISLLVVTAAATGFGWFVDYFEEENGEPLTAEQIEVIEENVQNVGQKQTCNGYTMELRSVLTDGYNMFVAIGITAPEDVYLDRTVKEGYDPAAPVIWNGENSKIEMGDRGYASTWNMSDDGDGKSNTHNIVYLMSTGNEPFTEGDTIKIHIEDLYAEYTNDVYGRELEKKYGFAPKLGLITEEEAEKLYPMELLAEGSWDFEIQFKEINTPFVEVMDQPVDYVMQAMEDVDDDQIDVNTKITSIRISPIGVVCEYDAVGYSNINGVWGDIVMKNGDKHRLNGNTVGGCSDTSSWGMFSVPIEVGEIDHIVLKGDQVIPMPQ